VDAIKNPDSKYVVQMYYCAAARLSELSNKTYAQELLKGATRPYGQFMRIEIVDYKVDHDLSPQLKGRDTVKTWLITLAIAKRGKKLTQKKREQAAQVTEPLVSDRDIEKALVTYNQIDLLKKWKKNEVTIDPLLILILLGRVKTKTIALPIDMEIEPWTYEMLKYLNKKYDGKIPTSVPFTISRQELNPIIRDALQDILPPPDIHNPKNILRHWRISHLLDYYGFSPADMTIYTGWSVRTAFMHQGAVGGSASIEEYYHSQWRKYYPKLLRPIKDILR
jgi:hypothetical protein